MKKQIILSFLFFIPFIGIFSAYSFADILDIKLKNDFIKKLIGLPICLLIIVIQCIEIFFIINKLLIL